MSAAATKQELEPKPIVDDGSPPSPSITKLSHISIPGVTEQTVIAVDLDDVLCQTNQAIATWHNDTYSTKLDLSMFYYYYYWKNPGWGSTTLTFQKVKAFYETPWIDHVLPVPGAREGVQSLHDKGFRLVIVTARSQEFQHASWIWAERHFPKLFDSLICTGQFKDSLKSGHEVVTKLSKAQVCYELGAKVLIDDSAENAIQCATHPSTPTQVLLFGEYEWNKRCSGPQDFHDDMVFEQRLARSEGKEFWKTEALMIPDGAPLKRVRDWGEAVRWIDAEKASGRI